MRIIYLDITTYVGTSAIGAVHHYGKIKWKKDGERYEWNEHELRRKMTHKEVIACNKQAREEGWSFDRYLKDSDTNGFIGEESVIETGLAEAKKLFPDVDYLVIKGDGGSLSAQFLLHWPKQYNKLALRINSLAEEFEQIGGYGYAFSEKNKLRDKRAKEIDTEWLSLIKTSAPEICSHSSSKSQARNS